VTIDGRAVAAQIISPALTAVAVPPGNEGGFIRLLVIFLRLSGLMSTRRRCRAS
jgi:hypothetical protein